MGIVSFLLAGLSIVDMFLPRPYDGVVLEADAPGRLVVRQVVPGSGADEAGIASGDRIVGIDREVLRSPAHAAQILNLHHIGDRVPYLVRSGLRLRELEVDLGRRRIGDTSYLYASLLGFCFFLVGAFVLARQPRLEAARVFFVLSCLFLLFLVCRLRPASYSWVDTFVLTTGTLALLFLPGTFLHFFVIFPQPIWQWRRDFLARTTGFLARRGLLLLPMYTLPPLVYLASVVVARQQATPLRLISGAPLANWWVMSGYMLLGLGALAVSAAAVPDPRQRRGAGLVFLGALFGIVPFIVLAVGFSSFLHTERFLFYGVIPLILVPLTFAYAIVRFGLLDIRVILRRSLLYTATTAVITAVYALAIASFNLVFRGTELAAAPYFPLVLALAIVLLFEPLRHRIQGPVDRFFFRERSRLQRAMVEMGEAFSGRLDLQWVVRDLVQRLPELLELHFAALYLGSGDELRRVAGPERLPAVLVAQPLLRDHLTRQGFLTRLDELAPLRLLSRGVDRLAGELQAEGVEVVGVLTSPRRFIGVVLLSGKTGQTTFEEEELELLRGLLQQASLALETSLLLDERTRQAELARELKIAATIQASLLPEGLTAADGWRLAAVCRPAREVGGDFYTELNGGTGKRAVVYGDVAGKSVPGALLMMAAHEVLHALALAHPDPEELFDLANKRLHTIRRGSIAARQGTFVALGYLHCVPDSTRVRYLLAGQPPPLHRNARGEVRELELPPHRIPLGALADGGYHALETDVGSGELLLAYSDGVVEACSPSGEFFGSERLAAVLSGCPVEPDAAVERVLAAVEEFTQGGPQYDDMTLVAAARATEAP